MASCLQQMGEHKKAFQLFIEVEKVLLQTLGTDHPSYLTTKYSMASCLQQMGEHKKAFQLFIEVEKVQLQTLVTDHPS